MWIHHVQREAKRLPTASNCTIGGRLAEMACDLDPL